MWIYIGIGLFIYLCGFYAGWWLAHEYIGAPEMEEEFRAVPPNQKIITMRDKNGVFRHEKLNMN